LSFSEYIAEFESELLNEKLNDLNEIKPFSEIIHGKLYKALKQYLFLGGMPEVLSQFKKNKDIAEVRKIQKDLLKSYEHDFAKYTTKSQAIKTSELWNSIPFQLAKENKKFKYGDVKHKARASHYEQTIDWLRNAGLINIVTQISTPKIPLSAYSDNTKFKIYLFDVGILGAMLNISSDIILKPTALFEDFNGAFIENFVASELRSSDFKNLNYWTSRGEAEVDFIISHNDVVFPLEVKSGTSRNLKSLRSYEAKYKPKYILRTSPRNMLLDNEFFNIPLYIICKITQVLNLLK
jgi:predicted AAA+ superfamily ATPase